jgi:hypothetical protein
MSRRHIALVMLAVAAAFTVVPGCSTTKAPQHTTTPTTTSAPPQSHGIYEQCLTQHGVPSPAAGPPPGPGLEPQGPLPGPVASTPGTLPPPPGVDQQTWDNAQKACASLQPSPPTPGP